MVAGSTAPIEQAQRRLALVLGIAGPSMVVVVAATAWLLTTAALRPVARMTRRAKVLSSLHEAEDRLPQPPGRDEIAELGSTLNAMLARIEATVAQERAFIDNASHELRTPLAVLRSELELARIEVSTGPDAARTTAALDSALEETDRLVALAERLLVLAKADARRLVGPDDVVHLGDVASRVVRRVDDEGLDVQLHVGQATVRGDADALEQLLGNLVENAAHWSTGCIRLEATTSAEAVVLEVADDGPGFAPEVLDRAFDRFSRADVSRSNRTGGTGLGLAIAAAIAEASGGHIEAANEGSPLGGARVTVTLPVA